MHRDAFGTFHSQGGGEEDSMDDSDVYVDLGEDPVEDLEAALASRVEDARRAGMTEGGLATLAALLKKHQHIFRIRLGKSSPADVKPMRVRLVEKERSIKVKARKYPQAQRKFFEKYIDTLEAMDFFFKMPTADWQAAPLLVPKPGSRAKMRMAIDLRPVNAATVKELWPMPHLDSEIQDFGGSTCFATLDFVSGYWQLPLHEDSYTACGVVTPKGVYASRHILPGLAQATSYFQSIVEPLLQSLRQCLA